MLIIKGQETDAQGTIDKVDCNALSQYFVAVGPLARDGVEIVCNQTNIEDDRLNALTSKKSFTSVATSDFMVGTGFLLMGVYLMLNSIIDFIRSASQQCGNRNETILRQTM